MREMLGVKVFFAFSCLFFLISNTYGMCLFHRFVTNGDQRGMESNLEIEEIKKLQTSYQQFVNVSDTDTKNFLSLATRLLNDIKMGKEYKPPVDMGKEQRKFVFSRLRTLIFAAVRALKENESALGKLSDSDDVIRDISGL